MAPKYKIERSLMELQTSSQVHSGNSFLSLHLDGIEIWVELMLIVTHKQTSCRIL